jgi:hypothetical protein
LPPRTATCKVKEDGSSIECNWAEAESEGYLKRLFSPENAPNIGLFAIGILGIISALLTIRAINKQAEIAANSQRSWIIPKGVDKPDLSGIWVLRASCQFEVFGLSPVRVFESSFSFRFVESKTSQQRFRAVANLPETPDYSSPATLEDSPEMGAIWPPGATFTVTPMLENTIAEKEQLQSLKDGKSVLCLYGYIRYRDAFDKSKMRETRFCFTCGKQNPFQAAMDEYFVLGGPPAYNETD